LHTHHTTTSSLLVISLHNALPIFLRELLEGAFVDHQHGQPDPVAERLEPHPARRRLLGAADQPLPRRLEPPDEEVAAVVEQELRDRKSKRLNYSHVATSYGGFFMN